MKHSARVLFTFVICWWWFLLRKPSGKRLSTATCTLSFSGKRPAQELLLCLTFLGLFSSLCYVISWDSAALRLCSSVSLRHALATFVSEQFLLFWSAETPHSAYKRGRIATSLSWKNRCDLRQWRKAVLIYLLFHWLLLTVTYFAQFH